MLESEFNLGGLKATQYRRQLPIKLIALDKIRYMIMSSTMTAESGMITYISYHPLVLTLDMSRRTSRCLV